MQAVGSTEQNRTREQVCSRESASRRIDRIDALVEHSWLAFGSRVLPGSAFTIVAFNAPRPQRLH